MWHPSALRAPEPDVSGYRRRVAELRTAALAAEVRFTGLRSRGPTQSVTGWEQDLVTYDDLARTAWAAWADAVFGA